MEFNGTLDFGKLEEVSMISTLKQMGRVAFYVLTLAAAITISLHIWPMSTRHDTSMAKGSDMWWSTVVTILSEQSGGMEGDLFTVHEEATCASYELVTPYGTWGVHLDTDGSHTTWFLEPEQAEFLPTAWET